MDDFEKRLRELPLRQPSDELDDRVLAFVRDREPSGGGRGKARVLERESWARRRIPLWAALAASLVLAAVGFAGGVLLYGHRSGQGTEVAGPPVVRMQVIYSNTPPGLFDATKAAQDFLPEPMKVKVQVKGGV